jgi:transcriptional regulator with XRE-family HTH domain
MKLQDYLKENKINQRAFAKLVGVTQPHIQGIAKNTRLPSVYLAKKIEIVTEGKVSAIELLGIRIYEKN